MTTAQEEGSSLSAAMKRIEVSEADRLFLKEKTIALIGYGSQGRSQALNLRDSGLNVAIGLRDLDSKSADTARADGFVPEGIESAAQRAQLIMFMTPDESHAALYEHLAAKLDLAGKALGFAHGYALHFGLIKPDPTVDLILISPKGIGPAVRSQYLAGSGVAALLAVGQDASGQAWNFARSYAAGIGSDRLALFETSFEEETIADLFSEQAVIVGGMTELLRAGFDTMTRKGIAPELAYFECIVEAKLILDMIVEEGFAGTFEKISNTAEYGAQEAGKRIIDDGVQARMDELFEEISSGSFAQSWNNEVAVGMPRLMQRRKQWQQSSIDATAGSMREFLL
jgi:ketol-acid reductoisomerase